MFSLPRQAANNDTALAFSTHLNYLRAFNQLLNLGEGSGKAQLERLYARINKSGLCEAKRREAIDEDTLKKSLSHAWGIERILYANQEAASDDIVLRLANNWASIQAYYVFYHATQALQVAKGHKRSETHTKTQNTFINLWASRRVDLAPWTFAYHPFREPTIPDGIRLNDKISNLTQCDESTAWSLCCKALRTTRGHAYEDALDKERAEKQKRNRSEWEKEEKGRIALGKKQRKTPRFSSPTLTVEEKARVNSNLRPYSLMDYLYRLRIKTNYEDADMFVDGPSDSKQSIVVYTCLCNLASATLFLSELSIISIWGKKSFSEYYQDWHGVKRTGPRVSGLWDRASVLADYKL